MVTAEASTPFSPTAAPEADCEFCHDCRPLFEQSVTATHDALTLQPSGAIYIDEAEERMPGFRFPDTVKSEFTVLGAKLRRVKRIAGLYGQAFLQIEALGVQIPFPGAAAFAANVVHAELDWAVREYASVQLDEMEYDGNIAMRLLMGLSMRTISAVSLAEPQLRAMIRDIVYGNLVVFVEVFPIYTFCIKHFEQFGAPRSEANIAAFDTCLESFITWWDDNNFGSGDGTFIHPRRGSEGIQIDRNRLFKAGILAGLRGDRRTSAMEIMENEQRFTLQEYMYDRIDWGWNPRLSGGWDLDDPFYVGAYLRDIALTFAADPTSQSLDPKFRILWTGGNVTEVGDRLVFTTQGIDKFIEFCYGSDRGHMMREISVIRSFANAR